MFRTEAVFHREMSTLNEEAPLNMAAIVVTDVVSQPEMSILKVSAPANKDAMSVTPRVFHEGMPAHSGLDKSHLAVLHCPTSCASPVLVRAVDQVPPSKRMQSTKSHDAVMFPNREWEDIVLAKGEIENVLFFGGIVYDKKREKGFLSRVKEIGRAHV